MCKLHEFKIEMNWKNQKKSETNGFLLFLIIIDTHPYKILSMA